MNKSEKVLAIIPARGGSKGLPRKNIKPLLGKPLIFYTIDAARSVLKDVDICVSTDDIEIRHSVENYGLNVPFLRPNHLATDHSSTVEVLLHALQFYEKMGKTYDVILLLQPTSPFRLGYHIQDALELYDRELDMVVSVKKSHVASCICCENSLGFLELTLNREANRRQEMQEYYEYNGALYIINVRSLLSAKSLVFKKTKKYVMDEISSVDIDSILDFQYAEFLRAKI